MMRSLLVHAERVAHRAKRRRLQEIAGAMSMQGIIAEIGASEVVCRGKALTSKWLTDPLMRFAGRPG